MADSFFNFAECGACHFFVLFFPSLSLPQHGSGRSFEMLSIWLRCLLFFLSVPRLLFLVRDPLGVRIWSGICLHAPDLAQNRYLYDNSKVFSHLHHAPGFGSATQLNTEPHTVTINHRSCSLMFKTDVVASLPRTSHCL